MSELGPNTMTEDQFDIRFTVVETSPHGDSTVNTHAEVMALIAEKGLTEKHVWSVIEAEGNLYLAAGFHTVDHVAYVVTNEPWETGQEEAVWLLDEDVEKLDD